MSIIEYLISNKDIVDIICNIFISFGTVGAVIVSLYFSYRSNNPKLKIKVKASAQIKEDFNPDNNKYEEVGCYVLIEVHNLGILPIEINCFFWQVGFFKKKNFYQSPSAFDRRISSQDHAILNYRQDANYYVDLDLFLAEAKDILRKNRCNFLRWLTVKFYYIVVKSNVGDLFRAKIDKSLQQEILRVAKGNGI